MLATDHAKEARFSANGSDYKFVESDEFLSLLVSPRRFVRADQRREGIRGLLDVQSNCRFLILEKDLFGPVTPWSGRRE